MTGLAFVTVAVVSMGGCTGDPAPGRPTPSQHSSTITSQALSPSFVPSPGPSADAAEAALAAYRGFRKAQIKAGVTGRVKGSGLDKYAFDDALGGAEGSILLFQQRGIVMRGQPTFDPRVTAVDLSGRRQVMITDCFDTTRWEPVFAKTGKSARAPGQALRTVVDAVAEVYNDRWMIRTVTTYWDRPC